MNRRSYLRALPAVAAGAAAGCLDGGSPNTALGEPERDGDTTSEDLPYPAWGQQVPDVTVPEPLADRDVRLRDVDRPYFTTFYFTHCQTVCPVLVSTLREVQAHSVDEGYADEVGFYPITFDPARDDADRFRTYAEEMHVDLEVGNWHFLRPDGERRAKQVVAEEFGVFFEQNEPDPDGNYMFTHQGLILLVNADGYVERAYRSDDWDESQFVDDLERVRGA